MNAVVYSPIITPRVDYIFSTLLKAIGFQQIFITDNINDYSLSEYIKFNYSNQSISNQELLCNPYGLLFQSEIKKQDQIKTELIGSLLTKSNEKPSCFSHNNNCNSCSDFFSAAFFLLSRYEEYLPHNEDIYGRYAHENSVAFQLGFLQKPIINIWLADLKKTLLQKFAFLKLNETKFRFIPTFDIDIAWSYKNKGVLRNTGGLLKDLLKGNLSLAKERIQVLLRKRNDPFDCYEWLNKINNKHALKPIYFFLLAQKNKGYDKNILPSAKAFQNLIKQHSDRYDVGIHPSWQSGDDDKLINQEIELLGKISGRNIHLNRQHYIRMSLPNTYRKLLQANITDDYSMGYGSINGFRASYCLPFQWYDLEQEKTSQLIIHPFCFMDANSFFEQHLTPQKALDEMLFYYNTVKEINGEFISIWHNHFLGTDKMFTGWKEAYGTAINTIC